jgi:septal ring factor EnvC (AmiA/AmiB activator)
MSDVAPEVQQELSGLRTEIAGLKSDIAKLETETRVTKHDVQNLREMFAGLGHRIEKLDEKLGGKIDALSEKIGSVNLSQQRSAGFVAGVIAAASIAAGALLFLAKLLFAPGVQ